MVVTIWTRCPVNADITCTYQGSIPKRSRFLNSSVSADNLAFTDDRFPEYW